ncbi:hypothetical protein EW146_g9724 [Bondarzewia mesenterica]|uniref:Uncharacterized protein n=1 Tax=Bondarzewia mesenterica TaxID=1095465 RepID=A0A4S4L5Q8_9AGAM|nr:hypothetical protein EW146_g9724 [Bondarzewia mesenterica]
MEEGVGFSDAQMFEFLANAGHPSTTSQGHTHDTSLTEPVAALPPQFSSDFDIMWSQDHIDPTSSFFLETVKDDPANVHWERFVPSQGGFVDSHEQFPGLSEQYL